MRAEASTMAGKGLNACRGGSGAGVGAGVGFGPGAGAGAVVAQLDANAVASNALEADKKFLRLADCMRDALRDFGRFSG